MAEQRRRSTGDCKIVDANLFTLHQHCLLLMVL